MKPGRELDALVADKVMGHPMPTAIGAWDIKDLEGKTFEICPHHRHRGGLGSC